jgi:hypothetical protein
MWISVLGYLASASVLVTFCMSTMIPLRVVALASNVLFASFGALAHIWPVMILHVVLLPVNTLRLIQIRRLVKGMTNAQNADLSIEALLPFMSRQTYSPGASLVRQGDPADRMFYVIKGEVEVREIGKKLGPGSVIGEIGVFARDHTRTATVDCLTECEVFELTETKAKEIYFQNPAFGYAVLQMVIARLMENVSLSRTARPASTQTSNIAAGQQN